MKKANAKARSGSVSKSPFLSIVVPVCNEEENLIPLKKNITDAMAAVRKSYEVILVDDGSTDGSREVIRVICEKDRRFRYLFFEANHGQTAAFDAGFKAANGDIIITMDADLQTDAYDIPVLLSHIGTSDAVIGYRQKRQDNWMKRASSRIANAVRNRLSGEDIRDVGCPLKAFRREALSNIKLFKGMHRFFPTLLKMEGCTVKEVPVHHYPRQRGKSKYNIRNRALRAFVDLVAVCWMKKRILNYRVVESGGAAS